MLNAALSPTRAHRVNKAVLSSVPRLRQAGAAPACLPGERVQRQPVGHENEIPYTHDPTNPYNWVRVRLVGGGRYSGRGIFRLSDFELRGDLEGTGQNWPVIRRHGPVLFAVEEIFRVPAAKEGWPNFPTELRRANYGRIARPSASVRLGQAARMKFSKMRSSADRMDWRARSICCCGRDGDGQAEMVSTR